MQSKIVDVRQLKSRQFQPLLQAESRAWWDNLHWDFTFSTELISTCLDQKRLTGFALVEEDRVKAYCLYFYEGSKGSIGNLFAEPESSTGIRVPALIDRTLDALITVPRVRRIEAQLPHLNLEQVAPHFHARSFQIYHREFMAFALDNAAEEFQASLEHRNRQAAPLSSDFLFEPWERKHDREAAQLLYHAYRDHIDAAVNTQYGTLAGTTRLVESIVRQRGCGDYLEFASTVAIHRSTGRLAGVLCMTRVRPDTAHIPQIAVANNFQGSGLGTALLQTSFARLARESFSEVSLTVTALNSRAVRLYRRLGFRTFREFGAFVWNRP